MNVSATRIAIPGTTNVRDLGGLATTAGSTIRPGLLFRSEVLALPGASEAYAVWDDENSEACRELGLRTVIDLRSEAESARTPSAWRDATGASVLAFPISEGGEGTDTNYMKELLNGTRARFDADDLAAFYCLCLDRRATTLAAAVQVIADTERLPVLVHCSAGKDRTGLLTALVLEVLGVPRETVLQDYTLTGALRPNRVEVFAPMLEAAGVSPDDARALFETPRNAMESALAYVDRTWGSAEGYLTDAGGLDPDALQTLRDLLLR
jgi:protein-tyrosine phosphatase